MRDPNPQVAPFAVDAWPWCERWERAGRATLWDRLEVEAWAEHAELELALEIDRRFDVLLDRIRAEAWPALPELEG
jgi:hypothetical protein